ncbi:MAG TPA: DNA polymerase, partial [Candidatus Acidoferrales bacterium]
GEESRPKILHDPKLATLLLEPMAGRIAGIRDATQLYSYLLRPTTSKHDLAGVVLRHTQRVLAGAPGERADQILRLAPALRAEVESQGLLPLYENMDLPLAPVLARMERHGVRVDRDALGEMSAAMENEVRRLEREIFDLAGQEFNINSPQQLAEILFDKLNLPAPRRSGKTKARSTAADVLENLAAAHPLPAKVIEFREVSKLKSTYVDALPRLIHPATGRVHTSFNQTGTATGRLSSSDPNLQNIPVRTELGRQIRAAFAASPGWTLVSADYSQIELRILAHVSEDPLLVEAFRTGQDIHARTAQEVFGVGPMMQTAEHRRAAKAINFGIIYGLSPFGLAQQLGIEQKEAAKFIAAYFERYRGVKDYLDRTLAEVRKSERTRTLFGRVRPIPEIHSKVASQRNFAERTALNTPLQGAAADLIKLAMIDIDRQLDMASRTGSAPSQARMILQVHDELLFECPLEEVEPLRALVKPAMENVCAPASPATATTGAATGSAAALHVAAAWPDLRDGLKVPLVADFKAGPNWRDMQ